MRTVGRQQGVGAREPSAAQHATSGRPRQFDEEQVLDELVALFWRQGFAQTSMADLVAASGVHKPSLYRTFGTKDELVVTVLRRYLAERRAVLDAMVARVRDGVDGVHDFLDRFESEVVDDPARNGCMVLVASSEFAGSLPGWDGFAVEYSAAFRELLRSLVVRAGVAGEPDPAVADQRAEVLVMAIFGIQTMVRAGAGQASSHASFAALHAMVDAWR